MRTLTTAITLCTLTALATMANIRVAGDLLVDLNAGDLTAIGAGNEVNLWPNNGTTPDFESVNGTGGPTFQLRNGVPTVRFNNKSAHCMTNGAFGSVPASILGANTWSIEAWVYRENSTGGATIFSWASRDNNPTPNGQSMELRYFDANNTVEHHGTGYNVPWGGYHESTVPPPPYGEWHYIVATRDSTGREYLYFNGHMVTEAIRPNTNLPSDGLLTLGSTHSRSSGWMFNFTGDISQVRLHSDTLTPEDILTNYHLDNTRYSRTNVQDALWIGSWHNNSAPASGRGLIIDSNPATDDPAILDTSLDLTSLHADTGSLTITDGAAITFYNFPTRLNFSYIGNHFDFYLANGSFDLSSIATEHADALISFGYGTGSSATAIIGDGINSASLTHNYDIALANLNATSTMTIRNAATINITDRFRIGDKGGHGILNIESGGTLISTGPIVGARAGTGELNIAGTIIANNSALLIGEDSANAAVTLLEGGVISATAINPFNLSSSGSLTLDGGTIIAPPNDAHSAFISGDLDIILTDNGVTFDIQIDKALTISTPIIEDPNAPDGTITKTGIGTLTLSAENDINGDIIVSGGTLLLLPNSLPANYSGTILLENNACIGMNAAGGANQLLDLLDPNSVGLLCIYDNNTSENIDLSNHPSVALQHRTSQPHTGTITPYQNHYRFAPTLTLTFADVLADQPGYPARITLSSPTVSGQLILTGDNASMSGGIVVEGGTLTLAHSNAAGSTNAKDVELQHGTAIKLTGAVDADFIANRLTENSDPQLILLSPDNAASNLDVSRFTECFVSTDANDLTYTGTITPANNTYLLGGGKQNYTSQPYTGFQLNNLTDGPGDTPRSAVIGLPGIVQLKEGNSYSGGTVITNKGVLFLTSDGLGAVPATPDPTNLTVDGGILRPGNANTTLSANRGIYIGSQGATIHPWGGYTTTFLGNLSGSGKITINDGGAIVFGGSANTYSGTINHASALGTLTIGAGDAFSWNPAAPITSTGTVQLNNNFDTSFAGTISGSGAIVKQGTGNLTLTQPQQITGNVTINNGTLTLAQGGSFDKAKYVLNKSGLVLNNQINQRAPTTLAGSGPLSIKGSTTSILFADATGMTPSWFKADDGATISAITPNALGSAPVTLSNANLKLGPAGAATKITGFNTDDWQLNRNDIETAAIFVEVDDETQLQITPSLTSAAGSAWHKAKVPHTTKWEVEFDYLIGEKSPSPADGFAFVLQNAPLGTAAIGAHGGSLAVNTVTPSIGIFVNIYNNDSMGWIVNGAKIDPVLNLLGGSNKLESGNVHFKLAYDGTTLAVTISKDGLNYTNTRVVDLSTALGSDYSWFGFTGGTGGSTAVQRIANFTFNTEPEPLLVDLNDDNWQRNNHSKFVDINDQATLELTDTSDTFRVSSNWLKKKVSLTSPFTVTARYWVGAKSSTPADGVAFGFQNTGLSSIGSAGSSSGFNGISDAIGWIIAFYTGGSQKQRMIWHQKGTNVSGYTFATLADNNISMHSGEEVLISVRYDLEKVTLTLTQGENTVTADSPPINLSNAYGALEAWFGITGGTGGEKAQQFITDFNLLYDRDIDKDYIAVEGDIYQNPITIEGSSTIAANIFYPDGTNLLLGELLLTDDATLNVTVAANAKPNLAYSVTANRIVVPANGATIAIADNGTGTGTFILDELEFDTTGLLTLDGTFTTNDKVTLKLSEKFSGSRALIDLTTATGLSLADFELDSPMNGAKLKLTNGILYAINSDATLIIIR